MKLSQSNIDLHQATSSRTFSILEKHLWISIILTLMILTAIVSIPFYQNFHAIQAIRRTGGHVNTQPGVVLQQLSPQWQTWVEKKLGDKIDAFRDVTSISQMMIFSAPTTSFSFPAELAKSDNDPWITDDELVHVIGMKKMHSLDLSNTQLTDRGIKHLRTLTGMSMLNFSSTNLTDKGMNSLNEMSNLYSLNLNQTKITDAALVDIKRFGKMERILLSGTKVTDAGVKEVSKIPILRKLHLEETQVTDAGIAHLEKAKHLEELRLRKTFITDKSIDSILKLPNLEILYIDQTLISPNGLSRLKAAKPNCYIKWYPLILQYSPFTN